MCINNDEKKLVLYSTEVISLCKKPSEFIKDKEAYLLSIISFARGFANITANEKLYEKLSKLMHGYENIKQDVRMPSMRNFFGCSVWLKIL